MAMGGASSGMSNIWIDHERRIPIGDYHRLQAQYPGKTSEELYEIFLAEAKNNEAEQKTA